jgi:predicted kinase
MPRAGGNRQTSVTDVTRSIDHDQRMAELVLVGGPTGSGKSTIAEAVAADLGATIASFDWVMSGLRAFPEVWAALEYPVERQRAIGWSLLGRVAEQQLRGNRSAVLDLVAREEPREQWAQLAARYHAGFHVIECICSDAEVLRQRVDGRMRGIPDWYELEWENVMRSRTNYTALAEPKLVIDAVAPFADNLDAVRSYLRRTR